MSVYHDLLQTTLSVVNSLGLPMQANIRLLPKAQETVDTLPTCVICTAETPESISRAGFEGCVTKVYTIQIVIISAGNLILDDTNLPAYLDWRQQVERAFRQMPLGSILQGDGYCWNVIPEFQAAIDRYRISELYDYQAMSVKFFVNEIYT